MPTEPTERVDHRRLAEALRAIEPGIVDRARQSERQRIQEALKAEISRIEFQIRGCEVAETDASDLHATVNGLRIAIAALDTLHPSGEEKGGANV
jgi:hypothetical protein